MASDLSRAPLREPVAGDVSNVGRRGGREDVGAGHVKPRSPRTSSAMSEALRSTTPACSTSANLALSSAFNSCKACSSGEDVVGADLAALAAGNRRSTVYCLMVLP